MHVHRRTTLTLHFSSASEPTHAHLLPISVRRPALWSCILSLCLTDQWHVCSMTLAQVWRLEPTHCYGWFHHRSSQASGWCGVDEDEAFPREFIEEHIGEDRAHSRIEYVGEYGPPSKVSSAEGPHWDIMLAAANATFFEQVSWLTSSNLQVGHGGARSWLV